MGPTAFVSIIVALVASGSAKLPHDEECGASLLARAMAAACVDDDGCRAKYVVGRGVTTAVLERDIRAILRSHGLSDETCRLLVVHLGDDRVTLAKFASDFSVACADEAAVAEAKSQSNVVYVASALLFVVVVAFVSYFVVAATQRAVSGARSENL